MVRPIKRADAESSTGKRRSPASTVQRVACAVLHSAGNTLSNAASILALLALHGIPACEYFIHTTLLIVLLLTRLMRVRAVLCVRQAKADALSLLAKHEDAMSALRTAHAAELSALLAN